MTQATPPRDESPTGDRDAVSLLRHSTLEDIQALLVGTLLVALAITLFNRAGLLSGGTVGLAFLAHYLGGWAFGATLFLINVPFYWLAWRHMGRAFTVRTVAAVAMVSILGDWLPRHLVLASIEGWLAAVLGGVLMGNGFLILFRHHASLGGLGILALIAQKKWGWRAGYVQLAADAMVVGAAVLTVSLQRVLMSVAAVLVLNLVIATNHRPGRYIAQ